MAANAYKDAPLDGTFIVWSSNPSLPMCFWGGQWRDAQVDGGWYVIPETATWDVPAKSE